MATETPDDVVAAARKLRVARQIDQEEKRQTVIRSLVGVVKSKTSSTLADHPNASKVRFGKETTAYVEMKFHDLFDYLDPVMRQLVQDGFTVEVEETGRWWWRRKYMLVSGWKTDKKDSPPYR